MTSPIHRFCRLLAVSTLLVACGQPADDGTKSFDTRGLIREIAEDRRTAVIRHEEIPGYMPKMTMELTVRNTNELAGLVAGDVIAFRLHADAETHWIDTLRKVGHDTNATPAQSTRPSVELRPGDPLPDHAFLAEDGAPRTFAAFRGKAVAFTFIFTRCPLPDFCPLMNRSFAQARNLLRADAGAPTNWQFLSLSFDPVHDTPATLRTYGNTYRAGDADRWLFGVLDHATVAELAPHLDLMVAAEGDSFSHNLRTVVLDPQGRIFRQFDHNQWTAAELAEAMRAAAQ
jgi:protein SCO1/2